ncbi:MAG: ATP-binding protein [bacterium]
MMDSQKIAEVNEKLASLMKKAFAGGTDVRFENRNVKTCWMMTECPKTEHCPLHGRENVRCWQILGTFSEEGGCCRLAEVLDCRQCEVYQASVTNDPMTEIGETFNNMMHLIERTQSRMVEMERLVTTGKLAASIAHDVNNPLFGISNYVDLIVTRSGGDAKTAEYCGVIKEALKQIRQVTRGLLEIAQPRAPQPADIDPRVILDKTLTLIEPRAAKFHILIRREYDPALVSLRLDREGMTEVFLNLIINALDSMPDGGELTAITKLTTGGAEIIFQDTGHGIAEADLPRIYELFFSKKKKGIGTGIGLYTARRIVENHGGRIHAASKIGEGSVFTITLPSRPASRGDA